MLDIFWFVRCCIRLQPAMEMDVGGYRGRGAAVPVVSSASGRCRRFKPRELDGFVFTSLQDELVVDDVYLRILVLDAQKQRAVGGNGDVRKAAAAATGLGQGLSLPSDLLVRNLVVLAVCWRGGVCLEFVVDASHPFMRPRPIRTHP